MNTTYQPSFLEKLLGKHYKWWYIIIFYFKAQTHYRGNSIMYSLSGLVGFGASLLIWFLTTQNSAFFNTKEILTYLWVGSIYAAMSPIWYSEVLADLIVEGKLTSKLIKPSSIFWEGVCEFIGRGTLASSALLNIAPIILLPFIYKYIILPPDNRLFLLFISFIPISFIIRFYLDFIFGTFVFWLTSYGGLMAFKDNLYFFLQGGQIPLSILALFIPWIVYQPIAFQLHHPMQIYLGKYSTLETIYVFLGGIGWCICLYILAKFMFKLGLKRYESVGL